MSKVNMVVLSAILVVLLLFIVFFAYNRSSSVNVEKFYDAYSAPNPTAGPSLPVNTSGIPEYVVPKSVADYTKPNVSLAEGAGVGYAPSDPLGNELPNPIGENYQGPKVDAGGCYPRDRLSAQDLLPKDAANSLWAQVNPAGQGDVMDQNFLTAGFNVGIDTQGQSLRNANLQIRSEPPNPQLPVSPWNIATITPSDPGNRKPLEIGGGF